MTGSRSLLQLLHAAGVERLFGNPGTTELPLLDELVTLEGLDYHLALQEGVAVGMADGYAQATGRPAVLSLHCTGGVANALGLLYNAGRAGTPLILLSGQQDGRLLLQEPFLSSDMVGWVRPLVKWAYEVSRVTDLARALRRALTEATTSPTGPVFLSLPLDVLRSEAPAPEDVTPHVAVTRPDPAGIAEAATLLRKAKNPLVVAGGRVAHCGAEAELLAFAEHTQWPVALEPYPGRFVFPNRHPLYRGMLGRFATPVRKALEPHDVVLVVGLTPFEHFLYDGTSPVPDGTRLVHLDSATDFIGRNHPVAVGVPGDLKSALVSLNEELPASSAALPPVAPLPPASGAYEQVADIVASVLRPDDILVEEAISARGAMLARIPRSRPGSLFCEQGGTIGWGYPAALGVSLARPDRRVLAVVGDGGLLMEIQALWTAARYNIPAKVLVLDNGGYTILKQGLATLAGAAADQGSYPGTDVAGADLVALASAFGVPAERVEDVSGLRAALSRALAADGPYLLDVVTDVPVRPLS